MAHNWAHSFVSYTNYVDGGYVCDELYELARARRGRKVVVSWLPARTEELFGLPRRVRKSIGFYRKALHKHLAAHRVEPRAIREFRTEIYVGGNSRVYVKAYVLDDRGKEHEAFVWA